MSGKDLRKEVKQWAKEIGLRTAEARLVNARISTTTAQKLTSGRYHNQPGPLLEEAIRKAMEVPKNEAS